MHHSLYLNLRFGGKSDQNQAHMQTKIFRSPFWLASVSIGNGNGNVFGPLFSELFCLQVPFATLEMWNVLLQLTRLKRKDTQANWAWTTGQKLWNRWIFHRQPAVKFWIPVLWDWHFHDSYTYNAHKSSKTTPFPSRLASNICIVNFVFAHTAQWSNPDLEN